MKVLATQSHRKGHQISHCIVIIAHLLVFHNLSHFAVKCNVLFASTKAAGESYEKQKKIDDLRRQIAQLQGDVASVRP
jgi:hypothetical protein